MVFGSVHWEICIFFKGTESDKKVTIVGLIKSHFDWKVLKLESCLYVFKVPKFGFEMIFKHDMKRVQGHLIEECTWHTFSTQIEDQDQAQDGDEV